MQIKGPFLNFLLKLDMREYVSKDTGFSMFANSKALQTVFKQHFW